jgi:hypothetical protein
MASVAFAQILNSRRPAPRTPDNGGMVPAGH